MRLEASVISAVYGGSIWAPYGDYSQNPGAAGNFNPLTWQWPNSSWTFVSLRKIYDLINIFSYYKYS